MSSRRHVSLILLICAMVALLCITAVAHAQTSVTARFSAEPSTLTVGDKVALTLVVEHPIGWRVIPPDLPPQWGELEVLATGRTLVQAAANNTEATYLLLDVTAWQPGELTTPELLVQVADVAGELTTVSAEPTALTVLSVLDAEDLNLRDIKPQATLPLAGLTRQYVLLGALSLLVLGTGVGLFYMLRQRGQGRSAEADIRTAYTLALDELTAIEQEALPAQGAFKLHYSRITDTVRRYIEREFSISVMDRTSFEIDRTLEKTQTLEEQERDALQRLLTDADLVKFAKVKPNSADAQQFINEARQFIATVQEHASNVRESEFDDE